MVPSLAILLKAFTRFLIYSLEFFSVRRNFSIELVLFENSWAKFTHYLIFDILTLVNDNKAARVRLFGNI